MTSSIHAIARLQDRDISRVVNRSSVFASRIWVIARTAVEQNTTVFSPQLIQSARAELTDLMVYAYLLRTKLNSRRRTLGKEVSRGLELAHKPTVRALTNKAARQLNIDVGNLRKRFTTLTGRTIRRELDGVRKIIKTGLAAIARSGLKGQAATNAMLAYLKKRGLSPRSGNYVDTLVRTHASIAYGLAQRAAYAGDPDLWGFEYVTMGDDRVRKSHEILHGVRRKWDDAFWDLFWPPNGWGCRCQPVALYGQGIRQTRVPAGAVPDTEFKAQYDDLRLAHEKSFGQNDLILSI